MVSASTQPQHTKKFSFAEEEMVAPSAGLRNLRRRADKHQRSGPAESDPDSDSDSRSEPEAGDTECGEAWETLETRVLTSLPNNGLTEARVYGHKSKKSRNAVKSNKSSSARAAAKPALAAAKPALAHQPRRAARKPSQIRTKKDWEFLRSAGDGAAEDVITWTHLRSRSEYSCRAGFDGN